MENFEPLDAMVILFLIFVLLAGVVTAWLLEPTDEKQTTYCDDEPDLCSYGGCMNHVEKGSNYCSLRCADLGHS
jgi:hypothetical protein